MKIKAGGPGSGRHAETVAKLKSLGFENNGVNTDPKKDMHFLKVSRDHDNTTKGLIHNSRDQGTQHSVVLHPDGTWEHHSTGAHSGQHAGDLHHVYLGASMFKAEDQVVVKEVQLRGRCSELKSGTVVSATVDRVTVAFPGEFLSKSFPIDKVTLAEKDFGMGANFENPYEQPVQRYVARY